KPREPACYACLCANARAATRSSLDPDMLGRLTHFWWNAWAVGLAVGSLATCCFAGPGGGLKLEVVDRESQQPLACRMHLTNAGKKALKAPKVPFYHDHFVFDGSIALKLPKGEYDFDIEHGPEYLVRHGHFTMDEFSDDTQTVDLSRFANMA